MSNSQWTPRPWHVVPWTDAETEGANILSAPHDHAGIHHKTMDLICDVGPYPNPWQKPGEAIATAHLIAAAPELYEALKAFVDAGDGHDAFEEQWPAARAALAKARGEQS